MAGGLAVFGLAVGVEPGGGAKLGKGSICGVLLVENIHSHFMRPATLSWLLSGVDCLMAASKAASLGGGV